MVTQAHEYTKTHFIVHFIYFFLLYTLNGWFVIYNLYLNKVNILKKT